MARVVHFEIHVDDPEHAIAFYHEIFGWEISKWETGEDYWLVVTGSPEEPGINGGFFRRRLARPEGDSAVIAYVCTIDVASVDETAERMMAHGGMVVVPKIAIPHVGWLIYCKDTEGNIFGITQADPSVG